MSLIFRIQNCQDNHHEVLGISPESCQSDIREAYKRLALRFHPDKCHTPGATDVFQSKYLLFSTIILSSLWKTLWCQIL